MKNLLISALFLLLINNVYSQGGRGGDKGEYNLGLRQIDINQQKNTFEKYKNLKGSPYVNEEFLLGKIYKENKVIFDKLHLRYNAFSDEIEIRNSDKGKKIDYGAIKRNSDEFIKIFNTVYVFVPFESSKIPGHYYEVLSTQKTFDLYKKTKVIFHPPVDAVTSYDKNRPAEFKQTNTYYLVDKNKEFYELPSNKNKLLKALSKENKKVKDYAKKNKLNPTNEKDLIQLVSYYNSVQ